MKRLAYCLLLASAAGCATDDDYPINPQSPGTPPAGGTFAGGVVAGRVCVTDDLRTPSGCGTRDSAGMTVTAGDVATTTAADGSFVLDVPRSVVDRSITVTGAGVVPTTVAIAGTNALQTIPAVDADVYASMLSTTGIELDSGTGSVLATISQNGAPSLGTLATTMPTSPFGPFFDGDTPTNWGIDGTGQRGVVWVPGLAAGPVDMSFANALGGLETQVAGITVRNGGITMLDSSFTTDL